MYKNKIMAEIEPRHYAHPYDNCSQCGGNCSCSGSSCFGGNCDYRERASSNRYDGGYPTRQDAYADQSYSSKCRNQLPQQCNRVAPMWFGLSENGYVNRNGSQSAYLAYNNMMPTWVGRGTKCGHYPINNDAFYPNAVSYASL